MTKSEKESLLKSEQDSSIWAKVTSHAYLLTLMFLMACCLCFTGLTVGFSAAELVAVQDRRDAAKQGYTVVNALAAIGSEIESRLISSNPNLAPLNAAIQSTATSNLLTVADRQTLLTLLGAARAASGAGVPTAYQALRVHLESFGLDAIKKASDSSSSSKLGLLCLASTMQRFGDPYLYLNEYVVNQWDVDILQSYLGSNSFQRRCELLIPEWAYTEGLTLPQWSGPTIPSPSTFHTVSGGLSVTESQQRAAHVQQLTRRLLDQAREQYNNEVTSVSLSLAFACVAAALLIALMIAAPILSRGSDGSKSDIRSIFREIEATVKLLNRYTTILTSCSARDGDAMVGLVVADTQKDNQGKFLNRIIDFVRDIRPYVPQSSFGDIENVPITGVTATKTSVQIDSAFAAQAIRELRLRDLRPDMGMQIVSGTVMVISLSSFHRETETAGEGQHLQDAVRDRLGSLMQQIETCINGTTGVVHTIAGDSIVALWNVTSSTSLPQVCAVTSALQLMKAFQGNTDVTLSIGIAQSFLLAGNVDMARRKVLAISGPAVALADRLEGCNAAHRTHIMIDTPCADAVQAAVITDIDFTVRPVVLLRLKDDADDYVTGYAVYPHRVKQDKLKAWNTLFKELGGKLQNGALAEALLDIEEFKGKYGADGGAKGKGSAGKGGGGVDRTAESWRRNIMASIRIKESSLRNANNATQFGV